MSEDYQMRLEKSEKANVSMTHEVEDLLNRLKVMEMIQTGS